jgi:uncharacterized protein (TIGR02145 family)
MIDNINFDMGDNFYYEEDYIGLGSYCPTDDCSETGSYYDLSAAVTVCPSGWRLPTISEWVQLNKNHANCTWSNNSPTANRRDTIPNYEVELNHTRISQYSLLPNNGKIEFRKSSGVNGEDNNIYFWSAPDKYKLNHFIINTKYCTAYKSKTIYTPRSLAFNQLMSCRCVQEVE